jgi:methylenetetrahydrofolate dehydrogenase (NADP+)/methenyltetrahydrofolate cyclohydrolase
MQLLDGTACSQQIRKEIATEVEALITQGKRAPHLAAVLVGDDGASQNYVGMKVRD